MKTIEVQDWPVNLADYVHIWNPNFRDMNLSDVEAWMKQWPDIYGQFKTGILFRAASTIFCQR